MRSRVLSSLVALLFFSSMIMASCSSRLPAETVPLTPPTTVQTTVETSETVTVETEEAESSFGPLSTAQVTDIPVEL